MFQPSLEKLFDRYRRRGDAAALGEVFDRTAGELQRLALHLVRDPAEAEDVLQSTYLAAIESAASYDASRPLVPWLVGILANQAALARRRARREVEPDRLERREEHPPADVAGLAEFSSLLGEALARLPEPYAEVLRMHLADGKRSVDIARELGREPGTVRMQVHRGLDLLRRTLPAGFATGAVVASLSGPARAAIRERVVAEALRRGATLAPSALGAGAAVKLAAAAALAAGLAAAIYVGWPEPAADPDPALASASPAPLVPAGSAGAPGGAGRVAAPLPAGAEGAGVAAEAVPSGPWLVGSVRVPAHLAADAVTLEVRALGRGRVAEGEALSGRAESSGAFQIDLAPLFQAATRDRPLEELVVRAEHPRTTRAEGRVRIAGVEPRAAYSLELALDEAAVLFGRVLPPAGHAGPVEVGLVSVRDGRPRLPLIDRARAGPDGAFVLRAAEARACCFVAFAVGALPLSRAVELAPGAPLDAGALALEPGLALEGTVTRAGAPVERALVGITAPGEWELVLPLFGARLGWRDGALHRTGAVVETDAEGRFSALGFEAGAHELSVLRGEGVRGVQRLSPSVRVDAPGFAALEIASARLELEVLDADRRPARGSASVDGAAGPTRLVEGRVVLDVAPYERRSVTIESAGHRTETFEIEAPGPGETRAESLWLLRDTLLATLELALASHGDEELELDFVALDAGAEAAPRLVRRVRASGGRAVLDDLPAGRWRVHAFVGNSYRHFAELYAPAELEVELAPAGRAARELRFESAGRVRLDVVDEHGARVAAACRARDAAGRELALRFVARGDERVGSAEGRLSDAAANDVYPNLAPGEYVFELSAAGRARVERRVRVEAGEVHELAIVLARTE